jgi:hypothetical protein
MGTAEIGALADVEPSPPRSSGGDPSFGKMYLGGRFCQGFVFDLMEAERPKMERGVLTFQKYERLHVTNFAIQAVMGTVVNQ